jgi:hypothetical protein
MGGCLKSRQREEEKGGRRRSHIDRDGGGNGWNIEDVWLKGSLWMLRLRRRLASGLKWLTRSLRREGQWPLLR